MRSLGLLFSQLLLFVFGLLLVFVGYGERVFGWDAVLIFLFPAVVVYFIVWAVGRSLDRQFNASVQDFVDGKTDKIVCRKGLLRILALLFLTLLPFLIYLQLLALFLAISFVLYALLLISYIPRVPIAVYLGLGAVALGTTVAMLVGFYHLLFPPRHVPKGVKVGPDDETIWQAVKDVAKRVGTRPIHEIFVTPGVEIGVYQNGSLLRNLFGRGRRVLEVGLLALHNLSVTEFESILAHEYGHFSNKDTQWGSFRYSMASSLLGALRSTPGPAQSGGHGGIVGAIMSINPAFWALVLFTGLFFKTTSGFSRVREVMADVVAIRAYGGTAFASALMKVSATSLVLGKYLAPSARSIVKEKGCCIGLSELADKARGKATELDLKEAEERVSEDSKPDAYDSHPPVKTRVEYAERLGGTAAENSEPASSLFSKWQDIDSELAELFNKGEFYFGGASAENERASDPETGETGPSPAKRLDKPLVDTPTAFYSLRTPGDGKCGANLEEPRDVEVLFRDLRWSEALTRLVQESGDVDDDVLVTVVRSQWTGGGPVIEMPAGEIRERGKRLAACEGLCRKCPSNATGRPCGCSGTISYPVTAEAEHWLMDCLPGSLEDDARGPLVQGLAGAWRSARAVDKQRANHLYELDASLIDVWGTALKGKTECTSSHILGELLHTKAISPVRAAELCFLLGATDGLPDSTGAGTVRWVWSEEDLPQDCSVRELAAMLRMLHHASKIRCTVRVKP